MQNPSSTQGIHTSTLSPVTVHLDSSPEGPHGNSLKTL
jgi:hypothetical protein